MTAASGPPKPVQSEHVASLTAMLKEIDWQINRDAGSQWLAGEVVRADGYYLAADGYGDETLWRRDPTGRGNGTPLLAERQMPHDVWQHFIVGTLRDTDAADKRRKDKQEDDS